MTICYRRVRVRKRTPEESSRSAQVIACNDDLLTELLLRLPVKSLLKFKCVCKHWLALITDPDFIRRRNLKSNTISALYFHGWSPECGCCYEFVPLDASPRRATFDYLSFADSRIVESCKGLLLCRSLREDSDEYLVYNPTTKQFKTLPPMRAGKRVLGVSLAFDPSISNSYKVICIKAPISSRNGCQVFTYSSQSASGRWRVSGRPFTVPLHVEFEEAGVYWNGAVHWFSWTDSSLYFDLDEELAREMPMPPPLEDSNLGRLRYFGESSGHLHLVDSYWTYLATELNVYEMEGDRSGWFVKFRLDPHVFASSPVPSYQTTVLCVVRGEKEEDSFLVVHISDDTNLNNAKVLRYNFISQTQVVMISDSDLQGIHSWLPTYHYIESLSSV